MQLSLLLNEASGSFDSTALDACIEQSETICTRFGIDELEGAMACTPDRLAVAGGDGSIGFAAAAAAKAGIPLALLPSGTANDFARVAGIPSDLGAACSLATDGTQTRCFDIAWIDDRPFVNVASAGLAVRAARAAKSWKDRLGPLAYFAGAVHAARAAQPFECTVELGDDHEFTGRLWQIIVANSGAFGWGSRVEATIGDNSLDVFLLPAGSRLWFPVRALGMRVGRLGAQSGVAHSRSPTVTVKADHSMRYNVDGDVVNAGTEVRFRVEKAAFELIVG